jgi:hypothetical protein
MSSIQVPWGWFEALLLLTFFLHLLFMNVVLGGAVVTWVSQARGDDPVRGLGRDMGRKLPTTLALTVNLGVAPFLFLQVLYGSFIYTSSLLMAVFWLSMVGLVIIAYYGLYIQYLRYDALGAKRNLVLGASIVILLWVAFIFTNNMTLMLHPAQWRAYFQHPGGTLLNLSDPTLIPRYLHFVTASLAVGGMFLALVWHFKGKKGASGGEEKIALGLKWFSYATLVQIFVGLWFFVSLPRPIMLLFLGDSSLASILLLLGLAAALAALFFGFKGRLAPAFGSMLAAVAFMVLIRAVVRTAYLEPFFKVQDITVKTQYSPLILFLAAFAVGLAALAYMFKLYTSDDRED